MSYLKNCKEAYENIPIPQELSQRVQRELNRPHALPVPWGRRVLRTLGNTAAAAAILFVVLLNTMPAFAAEAAQLPVIGGLARILTFQSYAKTSNDITIQVEVPSIEAIRQDTGLPVEQINQEILNRCNQYADEALARAEEYRQAFLDTGGTLEEWAAHNIQINVGYDIKLQDDTYLSFRVYGAESWNSGFEEDNYYNLDLRTGEYVTLSDLLGAQYPQIANDAIAAQIQSRTDAGEAFFAPEDGGFSGIDENTKFYLNENHVPVVVFDKYEIASGSVDALEFEIGGN